jgi:DNA polymerase III subunit epsilon
MTDLEKALVQFARYDDFLKNCVYLDLETTGLSDDSEVVDLALVDNSGQPIVSTLVRPRHARSWNQASQVHGIFPQHVVGKDYIEHHYDKVRIALKDKNLIIYNTGFDTQYFPRSVLCVVRETFCAMHMFAEFYGEFNDYYNSFKWKKLTFAAEHCGFNWGSLEAHRAFADCLATRHVFHYMLREGSKGNL